MSYQYKNLVFTLILFFMGNLLYSQSTDQENNFYQLQNTLTNKKQSSFELTGFEGRAMQKIEELAGYIEIISNKEYDITFREHALALAIKLFYSKDVRISNSDKNLGTLTIMTLDEYLNTVLKSGFARIVVEMDNRQYIENLSQNKPDAYSGKLLFDQTSYYYKDKEIQNQFTEKKEVEIILVKADKSFGKKTMNVWNVYLGNIKLTESTVNKQKKVSQHK